MGGVETSLLALTGAGIVFSGGWAAIHLMRSGFDYMSGRGNPRNRAQAHESVKDILIGFGLCVGAPALATFIAATIHI